MNREEFDAKLSELNAQLDEMNARLEDAREQRNTLLRERFDLKEQRRYLRGQLREAQEADNTDRAQRLETRIGELQEKLAEIDSKIEEIETVIESTNDSVDQVREAMDEAQNAQPQEETGEAHTSAESWDKAMEGLNQMLQKGLQKVADTLENVDFETLGQDVGNAVTRAAKTVTTVAGDAAKGVENVWNEAKDNRKKPGGIGDYRVSGSAVMDGGCYNRITSNGACKVSSDLSCRELSSNGAFRACGNVDCGGEIRSSGSFHCDGNVTSAGFSGTGSTKIQGNLKSGLMNIPGTIRVEGNISAGEMRVSGGLNVGGDCEADSLTVSGGLNVGGMVNADTVKIRLLRTQCKAGSIGGGTVTVEQSTTAGFLSSILKPGAGSLVCDSIEGDQVDLTGVQAATVRGSRVTIRSGCVIDQVEYTETCSVDGDAKVGSCVKV